MNKAHFIKISICTNSNKIRIPPIPFFMTSTIILIIRSLLSITDNKLNNNLDIKTILKDCKIILKELKHYPPFEIIMIENKNTLVIIKTI